MTVSWWQTRTISETEPADIFDSITSKQSNHDKRSSKRNYVVTFEVFLVLHLTNTPGAGGIDTSDQKAMCRAGAIRTARHTFFFFFFFLLRVTVSTTHGK